MQNAMFGFVICVNEIHNVDYHNILVTHVYNITTEIIWNVSTPPKRFVIIFYKKMFNKLHF